MYNSSTTCPSAAFTFFINYVTNLMLEPQPPQLPILHLYDFIIVGGGTAGCVLASRLSEVPHWKILLIEAGPEEPAVAAVPAIALTLRSQPFLTLNYTSVPDPRACYGQPCTLITGRVLGGGSSIGAMAYTRGNGRCYDRWRDMGNIGWSYGDVLPYFMKSEDNRDADVAADTLHHEVGGPLSLQKPRGYEEYLGIITRVFENEGYSYINENGVIQNGYGFSQFTYYNGERRSTNRAFLEPVRYKRPNLHVLTSSVVTKILINPETKKAVGVHCLVRNSTTRIIFARKEIILSAGTIPSPQLLQVSGIGPSAVLSELQVPVIKILNGIGNNFHDHVASINSLRLTRRNPQNVSVTWSLMEHYMQLYNDFKSGPLAGKPNVFLYDYSSNSGGNVTDLALFFNIIDSQNCGTLGNTGIFVPFDTITIVATLRVVRSRGKITARSRDVFQQPTIVQGLLKDGTDHATFMEANELAYRIAESAIFTELGFTLDRTPVERCSQFEFGTREYFKCVVYGGGMSASHLVGSCKMGPTWDADAVVDNRLKVYGIQNLRVIDASIIPEIMDKNPMGPVIMIAEKGADMIKQDWLWHG